jgi:hypothetical protein
LYIIGNHVESIRILNLATEQVETSAPFPAIRVNKDDTYFPNSACVHNGKWYIPVAGTGTLRVFDFATHQVNDYVLPNEIASQQPGQDHLVPGWFNASPTSQIIGNRMYIINVGTDSKIRVFNLTTNTFETTIFYPNQDCSCDTSEVVGGKLYMVNIGDMAIFDPANGQFEILPAILNQKRDSSCLWGTKIISARGTGGDEIEIFDTVTKQFEIINAPKNNSHTRWKIEQRNDKLYMLSTGTSGGSGLSHQGIGWLDIYPLT